MIRPPPRSTLFPYTTLSRSSTRRASARSRGGRRGAGHDLGARLSLPAGHGRRDRAALPGAYLRRRNGEGATRSEEHTSELQSRLHLVCRLLLEKKKQTSAHG